MQPRDNAPFYEKALIEAISENNSWEALKIIHNILHFEGDHPPSLTVVDNAGNNFLSFALKMGCPEVALALLKTKKFDQHPAILFSTNSQGETLILQAACHNRTDIALKLLRKTKKFLNSLPDSERIQSQGNRLWARPDENGNTPLHYSLLKRNIVLTNCFLYALKDEPEPEHASLVNHQNNQGTTYLHAALDNINNASDIDCFLANANVIDCLLTMGADMNISNHLQNTPFGKLLSKKEDIQISFVRKLKLENRIALLSLYKNFVATHLHIDTIDTIRSIYYTLSGTKSLEDLLAAHLEVDPHVKVRNTVTLPFYDDTPPGKNYMLTHDVASLLKHVPPKKDKPKEETLEMKLPLYLGRLAAFQARNTTDSFSQPDIEQLYWQDRETLNTLINNIEFYLGDLTTRRPSNTCRNIYLFSIALILLTYISIETWAIVSARNESHEMYYNNSRPRPIIQTAPNHTYQFCDDLWSNEDFEYFLDHRDVYDGRLCSEPSLLYYLFASSFGILGGGFGIVGIVALCFAAATAPSPIKFSPSEYLSLLKTVQDDVLTKLKVLRDSDIPVNAASIRELADLIDRLTANETIQDAIQLLTRLSILLKSMRDDMDRNHQPFSLSFFAKKQDNREVIIELPVSAFHSETDEEELDAIDNTTELLHHHR